MNPVRRSVTVAAIAGVAAFVIWNGQRYVLPYVTNRETVLNIRRIDDRYSVSGQLAVADLDAVAAMGFRSIVCHRPDGEAAGQPPCAEIAAAAEARGIATRYIPVGLDGVTVAQARAFARALEEMEQPMLGYCRSGVRSTAIYDASRNMVSANADRKS